MTMSLHAARLRLPRADALALAVTLAMAIFYTWLDWMQPAEPAQMILALIPGLAGIGAWRAAGLTRHDQRLRGAALSGRGAAALAAVTLLMLPILGSSSGFAGWRWLDGLLYAPASGVAQELYFRAALLPGLERVLGGRARLALALHAAVFAGFHLRTFLALPSLLMALVVATVLTLAGVGWGWQVQRDRTVVWAMAQHCAFLAVMSMFDWG